MSISEGPNAICDMYLVSTSLCLYYYYVYVMTTYFVIGFILTKKSQKGQEM